MYGVNIAFKAYNIFAGVSKSPWVGFDNFLEIFHMKNFSLALRNTLTLNILDLIFGFPSPIILAILLNELRIIKFKKIAQTLLYLPHFLSWVIIGGMVLQILAPTTGVVNALLIKMGGKSLPFLTDKWYWLFTYTGIGIWQSAGWGTIIYLAAITGINEELYEAAEVDGAGRLRKIWHITLPGIRPTIVILLILNVGRMINIGFDRPYVIGNVLVRDFSEVLSTFVYRIGIQSMRFSIATAAGVFQSVVGLVLLLITNSIAKRLGEQGVW
jgi:putative aldouronate transport system permease protein